MKILQVYRTYFPDPQGGLQEAIRQICLATHALGFENSVFTLSPTPDPCEIVRPEGNVIRGRSWGAPASCDLGGRGAVQMFRQLASRAQVVHYHFPWPFGDVLNLLARCDTPSIVTYHSDVVRQKFLGRLYRPLMMKTLRSMSSIVATSPAYLRASESLSNPALRNKVRVIPLGIDDCSYASEGDNGVLHRLGIGDNEPFFLFIGVLRYYKGLDYLVRAASNVRARIVIAGSGPERERLCGLIAENGASNVLLAGHISDDEKVALVKRCRALVLPSHLRSEAFGMVLVEAAMYGRPMVSCEIGTGTSFVNADGQTGFVVLPERPNDLAAAMNRLLHDEALATRMGLAARARYERLFSGAALGQAYAKLYREVAKS